MVLMELGPLQPLAPSLQSPVEWNCIYSSNDYMYAELFQRKTGTARDCVQMNYTMSKVSPI